MNKLRENRTLQRLAEQLRIPAPPPGCRKHKHRSRGAAEAHIRAIVRRGSDWYQEHQLHAYQCRQCGAWHVGHNVKLERS